MAGRWQAQLTGPDGSLYPLLDISPGTLDDTTRIYQTVPFTGREQLTLTLKMFPQGEDLPFFVDYSAEQAGFTFDLGPDPQIGQEWELNHVCRWPSFVRWPFSALRTEWVLAPRFPG